MSNASQRRLIWTVSFILAVAAALPSAAGPKAEAPETKIDLGRVEEGEVVERSITIANTGDEPLVLLKTQSSCPCATLEAPSEAAMTVPPGGKVDLKLTYDTKDLNGPQGSTLFARTNDPANPVILFDVTLFVDVYVLVSPVKGVFWGLGPRGFAIEDKVMMRPGEKHEAIELLEMGVEDPRVVPKAEYVRNHDKPAVEVRFTLAPDAEMGLVTTKFQARVRVSDKEKLIVLPMKGTILGDLLITPPAVISPRTARVQGGPISEITVRSSTGGEPPEVLGALTEGAVKTTIEKVDDEKKYLVKVFASDDAATGPQSGVVYVMTTSADEPIVAIPIWYRMGRIVMPTPSGFTLDVSSGDPVAQKVTLQARAGAMRITGVTFDRNVLSVRTLAEAQTSPEEPAVLNVMPTPFVSLPKATMIEVQTDVPGAEAVRIPVLVR